MIREATINDYIAIQKISSEDLGYDCSVELVKDRLKSLDKSREKVFVAVADDKVVGFVHAEKFNTLYYDSMVNIQGLAVANKYRKNGFGKALMYAAEKWAKENGIKKVRLNSGFSRKDAHIFYRSIGYDNEKEQIRFMKEL